MNFSAIGVFKHTFKHPDKITKFEERVVLVSADSYEEAEQMILDEFREYATADGVSFLGEYEIFPVNPALGKPVIEIARSVKVFTGGDEEYLQRFWDDQQPLSCDDNGWNHVWFKIDEYRCGCYNCQQEREGQLWSVDEK